VAPPRPAAAVPPRSASAPAQAPPVASIPPVTSTPAPTPTPPVTSTPASPPPLDLPPDPVQEVPRDIESIYALWPAVVDLVRSENGLLGACIDEAHPVEVDGEELTLAYPFGAEFNKKKAESPANRAALGEALGALAGGRWRLRYELRDTPAPENVAGGRSEEQWVERFIDEFDAEELVEEGVPAVEPAPVADAGEFEDERGARAATGDEKGA